MQQMFLRFSCMSSNCSNQHAEVIFTVDGELSTLFTLSQSFSRQRELRYQILILDFDGVVKALSVVCIRSCAWQ
jgi:hypothetical protein